MTTLFDPITIGDLECPNRIFMAPLTRARADDNRVPTKIMADYYAQRAGAGLIISEATAISAQGYGWKNAPGIYNDAMEEGWKMVTDAVHKAGGRIYCQLWHMGRVSTPELLNGQLPLAPSAVKAEGANRSLQPPVPYVEPQAMTLQDIENTIKDYERAALRAIRAGFDGVEIHGANGYLIDQFLRDSSNKREDEYGGSAEERCRFMKEVVTAVTEAIGEHKTGIRLSPENRDYNSMQTSDPEDTFLTAAEILNSFDLAYLHIKETSKPADDSAAYRTPPFTQKIRKLYDGVIVANEQYDAKTGQKVIDEGVADAVAYGVPYIANPDLVERFKANAPLNEADIATFYVPGAKGYTDYPALKDQDAA